ncbi:MAG: polymorphic toxin-type HINT domain-containing protein, partial [Parahaliea sp.]
IRQIVSAIGQGLSDPGSFEHQLYSNHMMPVRSTTVVRMQSDAWENELMASIGDQATVRQQGGPEEQTVSDVSGAGETGEAVPGARGGYQGSQARNYVPQNSGGGGGSSGTGGSSGNGLEIIVPVEPDCASTWEDEKYQIQACDSWYCGIIGERFAELTQEVKVALAIIGDFAKGLMEGIGNQVGDLIELFKDPSVLLDLAKAFIDDPMGTLESVAEAVVGDVKTVMQCGPYDIGRIIGENINPAVALKVVSKLASISGNARLARYVDDNKNNIECNSFPAGTLVWTPSGPVAIETLQVGDLVESRHELSFEQSAQAITGKTSRTAPGYQRIETELGSIVTTPEHPFWVQGKGWVEAKELAWEDPVATLEGDVLAFGNTYVEEPLEVYNFGVDKTSNYFAGDIQLWVHNDSNCNYPDAPARILLSRKGVQHVKERHVGNKQGWEHKSKWSVSNAEWKSISRDTFRNPDRVSRDGQRFVYEKNYHPKVMGVAQDGTPLYKVRVVVESNGDLVTAFPQEVFKGQ